VVKSIFYLKTKKGLALPDLIIHFDTNKYHFGQLEHHGFIRVIRLNSRNVSPH